MPSRKSNNKIKIAIAVIVVAIGIGIVSLSGPESKIIASISFGNDLGFPKETLQIEDGTYYVDMIIENQANQEAKTIFTVNGENTKIKIGTRTGWDYKHTLPFTSVPDDVFQKRYPLYVMPDDDTSFTIMLSLETPEELSSPEIALHHPSILAFEYDGQNFVISEQR